jgi:hypothetical protein
MSGKPLDLDRHRGIAAQKATDIRRVLADVENNAREFCRRRQPPGGKPPPRRATF